MLRSPYIPVEDNVFTRGAGDRLGRVQKYRPCIANAQNGQRANHNDVRPHRTEPSMVPVQKKTPSDAVELVGPARMVCVACRVMSPPEVSSVLPEPHLQVSQPLD